MKGLLKRLTEAHGERLPVLVLTNPLPDPFDVLIARRAVRVTNRRADQAARYEAVHRALAKGRK